MIFTGHNGWREMEVSDSFDHENDLCFNVYTDGAESEGMTIYLPRLTIERLHRHLGALLAVTPEADHA